MMTVWRKVAKCTSEEINDANDSTCPEASGPFGTWTSDYLRTDTVTRGSRPTCCLTWVPGPSGPYSAIPRR